ncbi:tyrosine-type recombinase/integrase [Pseudomonas viridiflava]|uniref:tyrosine-type recombinase/integrase n=1 Tax=Pseudomonas viridiflava TaxID=33069 RepID=UPI002EB4FC6D|nr:tyrosine-type recombinase/integrase [Pseudomonas viridiflava]
MIPVSFAKAAHPGLANLPYKVPQFFKPIGHPYKIENSYLLSRARNLREKSIITTAEHIKEFLSWREANNREVEDVSDDDFEYYIAAQCGYGNGQGKSLSWNTVNSRIGCAHRFLAWCRLNGFNENITLGQSCTIQSYRFQKHKTKKHPSLKLVEQTKFLTMDVAINFLRVLEESSASSSRMRERNLLIAKLMLQCGLRVSEAVNFPAYDLPRINSLGHSTPARVIGKGGKARYVLIPNGLLSDLWSYMDIGREVIREKLARKNNKVQVSMSLFISELGGVLKVNWVEKIFIKAGAKLGVRVVPHMLRHTFGTYHYLYNRDLLILSKLMGHESEATTEKYYVHIAKLISYAGNYEELQVRLDQNCIEYKKYE